MSFNPWLEGSCNIFCCVLDICLKQMIYCWICKLTVMGRALAFCHLLCLPAEFVVSYLISFFSWNEVVAAEILLFSKCLCLAIPFDVRCCFIYLLGECQNEHIDLK